MTENNKHKIFTRITIDLKEDKDVTSIFTLLENFFSEHNYPWASISQRRINRCNDCNSEKEELGSREPYDSADDENEAW